MLETAPWTLDTRLLPLPRGEGPAHPVMEVLQLAAMPYHLQPIWTVLRAGGEVDIPRKAEAEYAASLHWLMRFALLHGHDWRDRANEELKVITARAKALAAPPVSPEGAL